MGIKIIIQDAQFFNFKYNRGHIFTMVKDKRNDCKFWLAKVGVNLNYK